MNNLAVIGIGYWGRILLSSFLKKTNVNTVSSTGNNNNRAATKRLSDNIRFKSNIEIADDKEIDSVIIAVPVENLYSLTKLFIKSGKNVFLEKPGAINARQMEYLRSLLKKDQVLYVDYLFTLDPVYNELKTRLKGQTITEIKIFWEKSSSLAAINRDILLYLLCHNLCTVHDLLFNKKNIKIEKSNVSDKSCQINLNIEDVKVELFIDRWPGKAYSKRVYVNTKEQGTYLWDAGRKNDKKPSNLFLNGKNILSISDIDLVDLSRNKFLKMVNLRERDERNLDLSIEILKTIEKIRK